MTTKVYRTPPVTPNADLERLAALKVVEEANLSPLQKIIRRGVLSEGSLKRMRKARMVEMAIASYSPEQIKLAFIALDSPLNTLIEGIQTDSGARIFNGEIADAIKEYANMNSIDIYIADRQRLLNACWEFLPRVEPSHAKAYLELMDKLQRDIAEARGVIHQRAGKRPSTNRPDVSPAPIDPPPASTEAAEEVDPAKTEVDWEGEFVPDDSAEDSTPS